MRRLTITVLILVCFSFSLFAQRGDYVIDEVILEPKDPILATVIAIGPGFLAHGFGHFYSEDYRMGLLLFGTEIISLILVGVGYVEYSSPRNFTDVADNESEVKRAGMIAMISGIALFTAGWLVDITMAGRAAEQYNIENNLQFRMQQESNGVLVPGVMLSLNF